MNNLSTTTPNMFRINVQTLIRVSRYHENIPIHHPNPRLKHFQFVSRNPLVHEVTRLQRPPKLLHILNSKSNPNTRPHDLHPRNKTSLPLRSFQQPGTS